MAVFLHQKRLRFHKNGFRFAARRGSAEVERNGAWARIDATRARGRSCFVHIGIQYTHGVHSIQEEKAVLGIAVRRM
jgi:hypothetical protein